MQDGIIIQARRGSTRLPDKILLPFYKGKRIIDILIENIRGCYPDVPLVLATTTQERDDVLAEVASQYGIRVYRGSEENVLERFIEAAGCFSIDRFVRVCSDNPFLQVDTFQDLFDAQRESKADYVAYGFAGGLPTIKTHIGLFAELTTLDALRRVAMRTQAKQDLEHVTIHMYTHPEQFRIELLPVPSPLEGRLDLRFTLDTMDDFELLQQVYASYVEGDGLERLLSLVDSREDWRCRMAGNIKANVK